MTVTSRDTLSYWHVAGARVSTTITRVDLVQARTYGEAVFAGMTDFIRNVDPETKRGLVVIGTGEQTLSWWFSLGVIGHLFGLAGQIVALKGLKRRKGDMF